MNKITVVGSLNMDLVVSAARLPIGGETIMGSDFQQIPGGKGANQAVAMARLGANVQMIGRVGADDFGHVLIENMKQDGVDVSAVKVVEGISTGVALITVQPSGENSIIVVAGANGALKPNDLKANEAHLIDAKIVVAQLEVPIETVELAMKLAKDSGAYTLLNPAPARQLSEALLSHIDLLTPNETELALLSGLPTNSLEEVKVAAGVLFEQGVKEMVVTLGSEGALYMNKEGKVHYQNAFKVTPIDTTAAGDSFTAALAVMLSQGKTIEEALLFATKVGALTVQKFGAQSSLPFLYEVEAF